MMIVALDPPDFRTISDFRKRHLKALADLFVQVLKLAEAAGLVKLGHVALDGTNVKANASKHKAMSYARMKKREAELQPEVDRWLTAAAAADAAEDKAFGKDKRGDELPGWVADKKKRLAKIAEAKAALEAEAKAQAEGEAKRQQEAEDKRQEEGRKKTGRTPKTPHQEPDAKAQRNSPSIPQPPNASPPARSPRPCGKSSSAPDTAATTGCENRSWSRCSDRSSKPEASTSSCCAVSRKCAPNGR